MLSNSTRVFGCTVAALFAGVALAGDNCVILIGDRDGFGFGDGAGYVNFAGDPVNTDGGGVLGVGDYLPDLNGDGAVAAFAGDDFDLRIADEINGDYVGEHGLIDDGSHGSHFTDLALSHSYDTTYGVPNQFPDPPSHDRNDASFVFAFEAAADALDPCGPLLIKIVFGDVGGGGMSKLILSTEHRTVITDVAPLDPPVEDGVIRSMIVEMDFDDVMTLEADSYKGYLEVEFQTTVNVPTGDAYYAIDYVQVWNPSPNCYGDVNGDEIINVDDLLMMLAAWGTDCSDPCADACKADINKDGMVDIDDLLGVLAAFGACPE